MKLVGSKPTVSLALAGGATGTTIAGLVGGNTQEVAQVKVAADSAGDIKVNTMKITFNGGDTNTTISPTTAMVIKDASGTVISNASVGSVSGNGTSVASAIVTFTGGYTVSASTTATFKIEVNVSAVNGSGSSVTTGVAGTTNFTWTDAAGSGSTGAQDATLITNFPTTGVSIHN
jgi:hypothetical protein